MPPSSTERRQSIDLMRFVAAFGIVWAHMQAPGMAVGYVALVLFLILAAFLSFRSLERHGPGIFWRTRIHRLALPWLLWSGLFLALDALRFGWRAALTVEDPLTLLVGPSIHLWFLPFVVLATPLVLAARRLLTSAARVRLAAVLLAPLGVAAIRLQDAGTLPDPFAQWAFALAPFLYGLLAAAGQAQGTLGAPVAFAALVTGAASMGWGSPVAPFVLGAALAFEALWRLPLRHPALPALGGLAYGIYLTHPILMLAWYHQGGGPAWIGAPLVFLASAGVAALLGRPGWGGLAARLTAAGRGAAPPARGRA